MILKYQRLVPVLLGPERAADIFRAVHGFAALIIEAENRRYHVGAALRGFQGWGKLLRKPNSSGRGACPGTEAGCKQQPGRISAPAAVRAGQCGGLALWGKDAGLLGVPRVQTAWFRDQAQLSQHGQRWPDQSRLQPQRRLQQPGQGFSALPRPAQNSLARLLR